MPIWTLGCFWDSVLDQVESAGWSSETGTLPVSFSLWVLPWLWTWAWFLFILEPFSLHLSSKQLLCHLKRVLQTIDQKSPIWGGGSGCHERERVPTSWVSGIETVVSPACCLYMCLSHLWWHLCFSLPLGVVFKLLTSGICRFLNVVLLFLCVYRLFLQGKRQ